MEKYYKLKLVYFRVRVKQKLLPTLFQYGDVFPAESEYWEEGGVLFLCSSGWRGVVKLILPKLMSSEF